MTEVILAFVSEGTAMIRVTMTLETLRVADDLYLFRRHEKQIVSEREGDLHPTYLPQMDAEGGVDAANFAKMRAGEPFQTIDRLSVFSDDLKEDIRTRGWNKTFSERKDYDRVRTDVFTAIQNGEATLANLVLPDYGNYVYKDWKGTPLPAALHFHYMNGYFDEGHYDLLKAATHLLTRSDVVMANSEPGYSSRRPTWGTPTSAADTIRAIPYYNAGPYHRSQIEFIWAPTAEDYLRLANAIGPAKLGLTDLFYQKTFELDLLGLRAAGAARFDEYYKTLADDATCEDDDR